MIDPLIAFDKELFLSVNQGMSNAFFDWLMPILRNRFTWAPLYLFIIIFSIKNYIFIRRRITRRKNIPNSRS